MDNVTNKNDTNMGDAYRRAHCHSLSSKHTKYNVCWTSCGYCASGHLNALQSYQSELQSTYNLISLSEHSSSHGFSSIPAAFTPVFLSVCVSNLCCFFRFLSALAQSPCQLMKLLKYSAWNVETMTSFAIDMKRKMKIEEFNDCSIESASILMGVCSVFFFGTSFKSLIL